MRKMLRIVSAATAVLLLTAACSTEGDAEGPPRVVVTTSILGDVVSNVAGDDADVEVLIPVGASPHDFVPSARQIAAIYEADLVVANGLELEEGLNDTLVAAQADGVDVLTIGPALNPLPVSSGSGIDPHVWMDPVRMQEAAVAIAEHGDETWRANAAAYIEELQAAHEQIAALLDEIPPHRRTLVTNHDSLGYLADRFGFEVVGTVIPGGSSLGDPSSAALADLVETIDREQVPAIFAESTESDALAHAIAAEAGFTVAVVDLYTGSLGEPGSGADTLIGMLLIDAERIASALG